MLTDFNLTIRQGETIALVGATGGGKVDHRQPVEPLLRAESRPGPHQRHRLPQHDPALAAIAHRHGAAKRRICFSGTISENIRYGKLDATDAEVEAAARLAGA